MEQTFEKRKKIIYDFICDDFYVPMKLKELAILLQVPKDQRNELKKVREICQRDCKAAGRNLPGACERIRICHGRRTS